MRIVNKQQSPPHVELNTIPLGECFELADILFMRVNSDRSRLCGFTDLRNGRVIRRRAHTLVTPVNAEVIVS